MAESDGKRDPNLALSLNTLGDVYRRQARFAESETIYQEALALAQGENGDESWVGLTCAGLAALYRDQGSSQKAEDYYLRALGIMERVWGQDDVDYRKTLAEYQTFLST
jgi:tetratricopeptide (TPR) repeat protein